MKDYSYRMMQFLSQFKASNRHSVRMENVRHRGELNRAIDKFLVRLYDQPKGCSYCLRIRCTIRGRLYLRKHRAHQELTEARLLRNDLSRPIS